MYYVAAKISVDKAENEHTLQFYSFLFIFELLFYLVLTKYLVDVAELPDPVEQVEEPAALGVEGPGLQPLEERGGRGLPAGQRLRSEVNNSQ